MAGRVLGVICACRRNVPYFTALQNRK